MLIRKESHTLLDFLVVFICFEKLHIKYSEAFSNDIYQRKMYWWVQRRKWIRIRFVANLDGVTPSARIHDHQLISCTNADMDLWFFWCLLYSHSLVYYVYLRFLPSDVQKRITKILITSWVRLRRRLGRCGAIFSLRVLAWYSMDMMLWWSKSKHTKKRKTLVSPHQIPILFADIWGISPK